MRPLKDFRDGIYKTVNFDLIEGINKELKRLCLTHGFIKNSSCSAYFRLGKYIDLCFIVKFDFAKKQIMAYYTGDGEFIKRKNLQAREKTSLSSEFFERDKDSKDEELLYDVEEFFTEYLKENHYI